ncbi:MAG: metallophosphoesterase [Candidatus Melainabacteria bacterium]
MPVLTHNALQINETPVTLARLPRALDGLRILQLSDTHFYERTDKDYYQRVMDAVAALSVDCVVLTGDIIHHGVRFLPLAASYLGQLQTIHPHAPRFAILGNHDYADHAQGARTTAMLESCGYDVLINRHTPVTLRGETITIAGLDDLWCGYPDIDASLAGSDPQRFTLMLGHNPLLFDPVVRFTQHHGRPVDLLLSGHTHAGHVFIPWLMPIHRHIFNMKYRYGLYEREKTQLYVTSGLGSAAFYFKDPNQPFGFPRFRFNTHPEIAVLTLRCA